MKLRTLVFTLGLSALIAVLFPFLLISMSSQIYEGLTLDDVLYVMQRASWCYHLAWFFAVVTFFIGLSAASGVRGNGRRTTLSEDFRGPGLAEINTNGSQMSSSGLDVTGHIRGDTKI